MCVYVHVCVCVCVVRGEEWEEQETMNMWCVRACVCVCCKWGGVGGEGGACKEKGRGRIVASVKAFGAHTSLLEFPFMLECEPPK